MRQLRYWAALLSTFARRFKKLILFSIVFGAVIFFLSSRTSAFLPMFSKAQSIGLVGRYSTDELPRLIQSQISLGLTALDREGNVLPSLATSWYPEEDGRVWIFKLADKKWQDGKKIRAADINYNFSDVTTEIVDEQTIKFVLKDPFVPFPSVVSRPIFKRGLLGTGNWKVQKITRTSGNFIESIRIGNIKNRQRKTYRFYPTEEAARTAYKLGEVSKLEGIIDPQELLEWENTKIETSTKKDRYVGIFFNTQDALLSGKGARQGLAYALDKTIFEKERAISPISPDSWAFNPQVKQYLYDTNRAKELLNEIPDEQLRQPISLVTTPSFLSIADQVKLFWEEVGIPTNIQVSNTPPEDFQALIAIQATPPDPDQYSLWHSTQTTSNITNYRDTPESQRIDKLLEDGRTTINQEERKKIYLDFQRFLVEDSPVIFLFHPSTFTIIRE